MILRLTCAFLLLTALPLLAGCKTGSPIDTPPYVQRQAFPDGRRAPAGTAEALLQEINRARIRLGAAPLQAHPRLDALAKRHAEYMLRRNALSHDGFDERFALSGANRCVENVARNYPDPEAVVRGWLDSPDHRANLLAPDVTHAGVAFVNGYAVLLSCRSPGQ